MKHWFGMLLFICGPVAMAHTSENQAAWNKKCDRDADFYRQKDVCAGPNESSTSSSGKVLTFKNCFQGKTPLVTVRYFKVNDSESAFAGQHGCRVSETRENEVKITIYYENGTRHVLTQGKNGLPDESTIYTKDGMLTCDKWDAENKRFKWCGLTDSLRPSTNARAYVKVDDISESTRRDILAGRRTLQEIFPLAGTAPATAPQAPPAASR